MDASSILLLEGSIESAMIPGQLHLLGELQTLAIKCLLDAGSSIICETSQEYGFLCSGVVVLGWGPVHWLCGQTEEGLTGSEPTVWGCAPSSKSALRAQANSVGMVQRMALTVCRG